MADNETFDRYIAQTGGYQEAEIFERRDRFFATIVTDLGLPVDNPFTEVKSSQLGWEAPSSTVPFYPSEDALHWLTVFDETMGIVTDRRNEYNNHEVTFWKRDPTPRVLEEIKRALEFRRVRESKD